MPDLPDKLVFVDVETTGMRPSYDRIIEIGIIRVEHGKVVAEYSKLLNPNMYMSPYIEMLTGITSQDLESAASFYDVKDEVYELLEDATFVAHNVRFDYGFVRHELKEHGLPFSAKQLCTVKLSKKLFPRYSKHSLAALIERFGFSFKHRHRAFDDAHVLWQFYQMINQQFDGDKIAEAIASIQSQPTFPKDLDPAMVANLPESPGVYQFFDRDGLLLYIGKSKNIRSRVLQHFNNDFMTSKQLRLCQKIARIAFIQTAGELGALLRESYLIKKLQPLYNRQLRRHTKIISLRKMQNPDGYDTVSLDTLGQINADEVHELLGIFRSKKQAHDFLIDIARKYQLCPKLLGIEKGTGSCFAYRLKLCKGACVQAENPKIYNLRFLMAAASHQFKNWRHDGPIEISEKNDICELHEKFVLDKWCILKNHVTAEESQDETDLSLGTDYEFDVDTYKILVRYLEKNGYRPLNDDMSASL